MAQDDPRARAPDEILDALDAIGDGVQLIDREFRYVYLNASAARHGRRPREELIGHTMSECYPGIEGTEMFAVLRACMEERRTGSMENRFTFPDGAALVFDLRFEPAPQGIVVVSRDVTARRALETQLRHAQKMDAAGRLAGGLAHDFNNLLTAIQSAVSYLDEELPPESAARQDVAMIQQAVERGAALTRQLLTLARGGTTSPGVVDANAVLRTLDRMMARVLPADVRRVVALADDLWPVWIDASALEQVVLNLVLNARDAMPSGGTLTIETANARFDEAQSLARALLPPGDYAVISVTDSGTGMTGAVLERLFEPFFTTKPTGRGTGLGLATSYSIVRQAGGAIWPYSEPGAGTTFRVYLPRTREDAAVLPNVVAAPAAGGVETVLLVEDDAGLLALSVRALERLGYRVIPCRRAREALVACERSAPPEVLVTDIVLPDVDGFVLAEQVRALVRDVAVVYMSGYSARALADRHPDGAPRVFVEKPFTPDALGRAVRTALAAARGPATA